MVDPRFLQKCSVHVKPKPIQLPKMPNSLSSIEKIIEAELRHLESSNKKEEFVKILEPAVTAGDPETDEGFYDKPSISPTNSI